MSRHFMPNYEMFLYQNLYYCNNVVVILKHSLLHCYQISRLLPSFTVGYKIVTSKFVFYREFTFSLTNLLSGY